MALPSLAVNDVWQLNLKGRLFGQRTNNVFYYKVTAATGAQPLVDFFSQWVVDFETLWCNLVSEDWTGDTVTLKKLVPSKSRGIDFGITWVGAVAQASLPPSTAAVISRWNYDNGPFNRGRIFIAGIPDTFHSEGQLTNPAMAISVLLAAQMDDPCEDPGDFTCVPGLYHRPANTFKAIDATTARQILRQQRRREIGVGE